MWTSSYLPRRPLLVRGALLLCGALGLVALGIHARRCPLGAAQAPAAAPPVDRYIPVRLLVEGTPGACVRIDGEIVGPIPAQVELRAAGPRRVFLQACKRGHLDYAQELELVPGEDRTERVLLPRYQLVRGGAARMPLYAPRPMHLTGRCGCDR